MDGHCLSPPQPGVTSQAMLLLRDAQAAACGCTASCSQCSFPGEQAMDPGNRPTLSQLMDTGQKIPDLHCMMLEELIWIIGAQRPDATVAQGNHSLSPSFLLESLSCLGWAGERMALCPLYWVPTQGPPVKRQHTKLFFILLSHLTDPELNQYVLNI